MHPPGLKGLVEMLRQVDAMDGQQIQAITAQPLKAELQFRFETQRDRAGEAPCSAANARGRVCAAGPNPADARNCRSAAPFQRDESPDHRSLQGRFDLGLGGGDVISSGGEVSPALLKPHPTQRQQRNLKLRAAESAGGQRHQPWGRGCRFWRIRFCRSVSSDSKEPSECNPRGRCRWPPGCTRWSRRPDGSPWSVPGAASTTNVLAATWAQ